MAKVMVVDDSATVRAQVSRALVQAGFEAVEATDGRDALQKVMGPEADSVLIVCDVNMPNMSGIEFLRALRAQGDRTRFGFVTSEGTDDMRATAAEAGAEFLIAKPFDGDTFRSILGAFVG